MRLTRGNSALEWLSLLTSALLAALAMSIVVVTYYILHSWTAWAGMLGLQRPSPALTQPLVPRGRRQVGGWARDAFLMCCHQEIFSQKICLSVVGIAVDCIRKAISFSWGRASVHLLIA